MAGPLHIGVEIGGTKLQAVLGTSAGEIQATETVAADATRGAPALLLQLEAIIRRLLCSNDQPVASIGIGFGGPVDAAGTVLKSNHVAGWENVSLTDWASDEFQLPGDE
jgi:glucokinase